MKKKKEIKLNRKEPMVIKEKKKTKFKFNLKRKKKEKKVKQRKKTKNEILKENKEIALTKLILELKKLNYSNKQIKEEFIKRNYPSEFIDYLLKLNIREEKMEKEEHNDLDDEELEEIETGEKQKEAPKEEIKKETKKIKDEGLTFQEAVQEIGQAVNELNQRLQLVEASLYRIRNA